MPSIMIVIKSLICCIAMFYIFMPVFIFYMPILMHIVSSFVCDAQKFLHAIPIIFHVMSCYVNTCCITIHLCYTNIFIFVVSKQIYVVSTQQIYGASRAVTDSTFSITPKKLSSLAVACGPSPYRLLNYKIQKLMMVMFSRITSVFFSHRNRCGSIAR